MKQVIPYSVLLICALLSCKVFGEQEQALIEAKDAVTAWLLAVDEVRYDDSWTSAAESFKNKTPKEKWSEVVARVRKPLGAVKTREVVSSQEVESPKNHINGKYIQIKYHTTFVGLSSAIETLVLQLEQSGSWRVCSYVIKPAP